MPVTDAPSAYACADQQITAIATARRIAARLTYLRLSCNCQAVKSYDQPSRAYSLPTRRDEIHLGSSSPIAPDSSSARISFSRTARFLLSAMNRSAGFL